MRRAATTPILSASTSSAAVPAATAVSQPSSIVSPYPRPDAQPAVIASASGAASGSGAGKLIAQEVSSATDAKGPNNNLPPLENLVVSDDSLRTQVNDYMISMNAHYQNKDWVALIGVSKQVIAVFNSFKKLTDLDKRKFALCLDDGAHAHFKQKNWLEAAELSLREPALLNTLSQLTDQDKRNLAVCYCRAGTAYFRHKNFLLQAARLCLQAADVYKKLPQLTDDDIRNLEVSLRTAGNAYVLLEQDICGAKLLEQAADILNTLSQSTDEDKRNRAKDLEYAGHAYARQDNWPNAAKVFEQAADIWNTLSQPTDEDMRNRAECLGYAGDSYCKRGNSPKAAKLFEQGVALFDTLSQLTDENKRYREWYLRELEAAQIKIPVSDSKAAVGKKRGRENDATAASAASADTATTKKFCSSGSASGSGSASAPSAASASGSTAVKPYTAIEDCIAKIKKEIKSDFETADLGELGEEEEDVICTISTTAHIMLDPVLVCTEGTREPQTYDRRSIVEHLKTSGYDPITRKEIIKEDFRPNVTMRGVILKILNRFYRKNVFAGSTAANAAAVAEKTGSPVHDGSRAATGAAATATRDDANVKMDASRDFKMP